MTDERGSGRTTKQLLEAPQGAWFFVQHRSMETYTKRLAYFLKRPDIVVYTVDKLEYAHQWAGYKIPLMILDHWTWLENDRQRDGWKQLCYWANKERK